MLMILCERTFDLELCEAAAKSDFLGFVGFRLFCVAIAGITGLFHKFMDRE